MPEPSLEDLFRRSYRPLVRALTVACGDVDDAADAVQDAFVQAGRHWRRVGRYDDPAVWLRRVAVNRLANQRRGARRRAAFVARARVAAPADLGAGDTDLTAAVAALPPGQRLAVGLYYLADLTVADVAAAMGVAPGTVKSQLHDARRSLAHRMEVLDEP